VTRQELLQKYIRGVELIDFSLTNFRVVQLDKDAAVVVYEAWRTARRVRRWRTTSRKAR
jgi:hypothetical protein